MHKKHQYAIAFISWMVFVTFSSLYSFEGSGFGSFNVPNGDKIVHFIFYFVAAVLGSLFLLETKKEMALQSIQVIILAFSLIFFGIIIEVIQEAFTTNRSGDVNDALANSIGAILGILAIFVINYRQRGLK
ncbi:MAG: VanZ family protein [Maribacter sp.]|nr:VanZ family protein [Maribacter sp.]